MSDYFTMNTYHWLGSLNAIFILISLYGIYSQVKTVWIRRSEIITNNVNKSTTQLANNSATYLLSLNQFTVSFMAYFSFFVYGFSIIPFNHFIVWPRLLASILVAIILFEIWRDRRNKFALFSLSISSLFLIAGITLLSIILKADNLIPINEFSKQFSSLFIVVITVMIAQGYFHQIKLIWQTGDTGAVDIKMSQFILMMDLTTLAFALSMGVSNGWPLMLLATVSGLTKIIIMILFRWCRVSKTAMLRRKIAEQQI